MPKTFNLSFVDPNGKSYRGIAADVHVLYGIIGGLPKYSTILAVSSCTVGIVGTLSVQKIYNIIKQHLEKTASIDESSNE